MPRGIGTCRLRTEPKDQQAQFAGVMSVESPFVQNFECQLEALVIEFVELRHSNAGLAFEREHQCGNA